MSTVPTSLARFVDEAEPSETSLLLLNRSRPVEVASLLDRAFADQSVGVADVSLPAGPDDVVCLVENGRVTAATPLSRLEETFLLVNSDRYRSGVDDDPTVAESLDVTVHAEYRDSWVVLSPRRARTEAPPSLPSRRATTAGAGPGRRAVPRRADPGVPRPSVLTHSGGGDCSPSARASTAATPRRSRCDTAESETPSSAARSSSVARRGTSK